MGFKTFFRHRDKNVGAKYGCNKHNRPDYRIGFQIGRVTMQTLHRIYLGLLKPPESNSLVSDSQKYYRKNFIACAIKFLNCYFRTFPVFSTRRVKRRGGPTKLVGQFKLPRLTRVARHPPLLCERRGRYENKLSCNN